MSELEYLARAYFHQDFDLDAPTAIDLVREFRQGETPEISGQLAREVEELLQTGDESAMRHEWINELGAYYEPDRRSGLTYREWFEKVLEVLREPR